MQKVTVPKIPILSIPDQPIVSAVQEIIPIIDIVDSIVIHKDGGAAIVMESTSLNFGLLSENEQQAVIAAYAALINSLSFSIQIIVRSQRKDITSYLAFLDSAQQKITNPKLSQLMTGYRNFIADTIKKRNVLGKRFFVVLPFSPLELGVTKSFLTFTKRAGPLPYPKSYVIKKAKIVLIPRRDHIIRQANRLGLRLKQLNKEQLIDLYYNNFNPTPPPPSREIFGGQEQEEEKKETKNE